MVNLPFPISMGSANPPLPDPVPAHPLLDGKQELGRGQHTIVIDKGDGQRVYKLLTSPADYWLLTAEDRPQGKHFPIVYADHGKVGQAQSGHDMYLVETERLYPLTPNAQAAVLANQLIGAYWDGCLRWRDLGAQMGRVAMYHLAKGEPFAWDQSLQSALETLLRFVDDYQVVPDLLKADNLMVRKDGTLVFSDPVFVP